MNEETTDLLTSSQVLGTKGLEIRWQTPEKYKPQMFISLDLPNKKRGSSRVWLVGFDDDGPDRNGLMWLPIEFEVGATKQHQKYFLDEVGINRSNIEWTQLSDRERERLSYAFGELNLPLPLAVHLAMNREDVTMDEMKEFSRSNHPGEIIGIFGANNLGKTTFMSVLALKTGRNIFNMDPFSSANVDTIVEGLKEKGLTSDSSVEEIVSAIQEIRPQIPKKTEPPEPFFSRLDHLLKLCLDTPSNDGIYYVDLPASSNSSKRDPEKDLFDWFAGYMISGSNVISEEPLTKLSKLKDQLLFSFRVEKLAIKYAIRDKVKTLLRIEKSV